MRPQVVYVEEDEVEAEDPFTAETAAMESDNSEGGSDREEDEFNGIDNEHVDDSESE